jgi:predicted DNA-binding transcriptional regulator YafY
MSLGSISRAITNDEIISTLAKVKGLVPDEQIRDIELKSNQITIDLTPWIGNRNLQPNLEKIKKALHEKRFLSFEYSNSSGEKSSRKIEPHRLVLKESNWYIQGYCTFRGEFRIFKLSRISSLEILDETFIPHDFDVKPLGVWDNIEKSIIVIKLLVHESLRDRMSEHCGEENIQPYGNNKLIVNFPFEENEFGYNMLLSFGEKCECLEPSHVRDEIIRRVKNLLRVYHD